MHIDLVQKAIEMGMSPEDIAILRETTGGGLVDLGLSGPSTSTNPKVDFTRYSAGRPDLTGMPAGPGTHVDAYGRRMGRGVMDQLGKLDAIIGLTDTARAQTAAIGKGVRGASKLMGYSPSAAGNAGRMAMQALRHPALATALKAAPVVGTALSVGDLILGDESLANKGMDAALMTAGGALGSVVPVVGTGLGIAGGKMVSDGLQWVFGDKMTPEERKVQQALVALNGGVV